MSQFKSFIDLIVPHIRDHPQLGFDVNVAYWISEKTYYQYIQWKESSKGRDQPYEEQIRKLLRFWKANEGEEANIKTFMIALQRQDGTTHMLQEIRKQFGGFEPTNNEKAQVTYPTSFCRHAKDIAEQRHSFHSRDRSQGHRRNATSSRTKADSGYESASYGQASKLWQTNGCQGADVRPFVSALGGKDYTEQDSAYENSSDDDEGDSFQAAKDVAAKVPIVKQGTPTAVFKVILIGDRGVGKTCIINRIDAENRYKPNNTPTLGIDQHVINTFVDSLPICVQFWDVAGDEKFNSSLLSHFIQKVDAVVIVYDITHEKTFLNVSKWKKVAKSAKNNPVLYILGNKLDLAVGDSRLRQVNTQTLSDIARNACADSFEVSACTGAMIEHAIQTMVRFMKKKQDEDLGQTKQPHILGNKLDLSGRVIEAVIDAVHFIYDFYDS